MFSLLYRIIDAAGQLRWALIAGEGTLDDAEAVTGIRGYLIDVTESQARGRSREVASGLRKAMASRATIEQAKGALMLVYGLDAEAAFSLLSWQSQRSNIKLRDLAERLVAVVGGDAYASAAIRQRLDEIVYSLPAGPAGPAAPAAPATPGAPEDDLLTVDQELVDGAVVLHLRGEIDMATGPLLDERLARAVTVATPPAPLVVDLSKVQHLGSVGVALLTACHRRCQASGIPMRIVAGDGPIASILSMIPIGLDIYDEVAGALAAAPRSGSAGHPVPGVPG
jgi:anti-anti-sigma factor